MDAKERNALLPDPEETAPKTEPVDLNWGVSPTELVSNAPSMDQSEDPTKYAPPTAELPDPEETSPKTEPVDLNRGGADAVQKGIFA